MDSIWFLFIFVAIVLLSYLMCAGHTDNKTPKEGADEEEFFDMPPYVEPALEEVGDDTEDF